MTMTAHMNVHLHRVRIQFGIQPCTKNFFSAVRGKNGATPPASAGRGHAARDARLATGPPARLRRCAAACLPRPKRFSPLGAGWARGAHARTPASSACLAALASAALHSPFRLRTRASAGRRKREVGFGPRTQTRPSYGSISTKYSHLLTHALRACTARHK